MEFVISEQQVQAPVLQILKKTMKEPLFWVFSVMFVSSTVLLLFNSLSFMKLFLNILFFAVSFFLVAFIFIGIKVKLENDLTYKNLFTDFDKKFQEKYKKYLPFMGKNIERNLLFFAIVNVAENSLSEHSEYFPVGENNFHKITIVRSKKNHWSIHLYIEEELTKEKMIWVEVEDI